MRLDEQRKGLMDSKFGRVKWTGFQGQDALMWMALKMARSLSEFLLGLMKKYPFGVDAVGEMQFRESKSEAISQRPDEK